LNSHFFSKPYPIYTEYNLFKDNKKCLIITKNEQECDDLNKNTLNVKDSYIAISWPGDECTVEDVDWAGLKSRNVLFAVYSSSESFALAYKTYVSA
jgi:hypothetical protein